ncbi:MAG: hypothetical protein ACYC2Y_01330 [Armatimonadota bacterium]
MKALLAALALGTLLSSAWGSDMERVSLREVPSGLTSPNGAYRFLDVADRPYEEEFRRVYSYSEAKVEASFSKSGAVLAGELRAEKLKPNFAYQIKLVGTPGAESNERIGLAGRWWQEEWDGKAWTGGWNLNDKGDGTSPSPNDKVYFDRRETPDPPSPTGKRYRYTGYMVIGYFVTDENGNASVSFRADSSYHVLWKTSQCARTEQDGPLVSASGVGVFGEWERLPVGGVKLSPGDYSCSLVLLEESFHGSGELAGNWAAAVGADVSFSITD